VISESLTSDERSFLREETDVARRIALNKAVTSSHGRAGSDDEEEPISDARTMQTYRKNTAATTTTTTVSTLSRKRSSAQTHRGNKILVRPKKVARSDKRGGKGGGGTGFGRSKTTPEGEEYKGNEGKEDAYTIDQYYEAFAKGVRVEESLGVVDIEDWVRSLEVKEFSEWKKERTEREPMRVEDVVLMDNTTEEKLDGDSIVDLWFRSMGKIEERLTLSEQQKNFIQSCFISLLPLIYGDQFDVNIVRLTKRFGIDAIFKKIFFEMPRRFGKTTSTAIVAAIIAYIIPGLTVGIYSIVKSASDSLVESVIDYYATISGMDAMDFVTEWNKQKGRVQMKNAHGSTSTVWGYSAVSTVRTSSSSSVFRVVCFPWFFSVDPPPPPPPPLL